VLLRHVPLKKFCCLSPMMSVDAAQLTRSHIKWCPPPKTHGKVPKRVFLDVFSPSEFKSETHLSPWNLVPEIIKLSSLAIVHCTPPMSTNTNNMSSSPNRLWSGMETSPFSQRLSPQAGPPNIAGPVASLMVANIASKPSTVTPTNQDEHMSTIAVSSTLPLPTNSPSSALMPPPPSTPVTSLSLAVPSALPRQELDLYRYLRTFLYVHQAPTEPGSPSSSSPVVSQMPLPDPRPMLRLFHSPSVQVHPTEFMGPTLKDISDVWKQCWALLWAMENPRDDSEAYEA